MGKQFTAIACKAFHDAVDHLEMARRFPNVRFLYLPASLHIKPMELKQRILSEIQGLTAGKDGVCCLYGQCFPDIDAVLKNKNILRMPCSHCYETLLGRKQFDAVVKAEPGTFFVEKELLLNFDAYCWEPLEFDDPQLRKWYFEHYRQFLYIRQPKDPDLGVHAKQVADRLGLVLNIMNANYEELNIRLTQLLKALTGQ